jgi:hypothetical protein
MCRVCTDSICASTTYVYILCDSEMSSVAHEMWVQQGSLHLFLCIGFVDTEKLARFLIFTAMKTFGILPHHYAAMIRHRNVYTVKYNGSKCTKKLTIVILRHERTRIVTRQREKYYIQYWTNCTFGLYPSSGVSKNWGIKNIYQISQYTRPQNSHKCQLFFETPDDGYSPKVQFVQY